MSTKQAFNDKLQGSVATHFEGVVGLLISYRIKKGLLLNLLSEKCLKSVNIWQSYQQERDCLVHFLHPLAVCWPGAQNAWDNHALGCNSAKYSPIKKNFHSRAQQ